MTTQPKTKAVGYIRVSTPDQATPDRESLTLQRKQIEAFCQQKDWELIEIYADEGATGTKLEYRTEFQKMIREAKAGAFDVIVIWKLSRFARNARDYRNIMHDLEPGGVTIASVKENIDPTTKTGKILAELIVLFAEWEHETIREQMSENKMARWREHRTFLGRVPFGYAWDEREKCLTVHPQESEVYLRIVDMYLRQGLSMKDIAIRLNNEGIYFTMYRTRKDGTPQKRSTVRSNVIGGMLHSTAYYGHYTVNRHQYRDGPAGAGTVRTQEPKPDSEQITFPIPALISKARWDEIQKTMEFRKVKTKRHGKHTDMFFLRDICTCARCGGKASPKLGSRLKSGFNIRYYSCYLSQSAKKAQEANKPRCTLPNLRAEQVEDLIWNKLMATFGVASALKRGAKNPLGRLYDPAKFKTKINDLEQTIARLTADLKTKERVRQNLYRMLEQPGLDAEELAEKLRANQGEIVALQGNIDEATERAAELTDLYHDEERLRHFTAGDRRFLVRLMKEIKQLSLVDRKILMESWIDGRITLDWVPDSPDGPAHIEAEFKTRFNVEVLQRFMDEGKISRLRSDSSDYLASHIMWPTLY